MSGHGRALPYQPQQGATMYQKSIDTSPYDGKCDICQEPIVCEDGPYCHDCEYDLYNWDLDNES